VRHAAAAADISKMKLGIMVPSPYSKLLLTTAQQRMQHSSCEQLAQLLLQLLLLQPSTATADFPSSCLLTASSV
jgi:hypothetical protein